MNFKKLSLILLVLSLSGHALMAGEQPTIKFWYLNKKLVPKKIPRYNMWHNVKDWRRSEVDVLNTSEALALAFDKNLKSIAGLDTDIAEAQRPITKKALYFGGIVGITVGLCGYLKTFANFQPRNRIVSALGTLATTASLVYCASRSAFTFFSDIPRHKRLLDMHCNYLSERIKKNDVPKENIQQRLQTTYAAAQPNWATNARAQQTFFNIIRSDN